MEIHSLLAYLLKSSGVFTILYGLYYLLFRKNQLFTANRIYLLFLIAFSLLFPLLTITNYQTIEIPALDAASNVNMHVESVEIEGAEPSGAFWSKANLTNLILYLYLFIGSAFFLRLLVQLVQFVVTLSKHSRIENINGVKVVVSNYWDQTFSFFGIIVLTESDYLRSENSLLLAHELAHAKQLHSLDLLLAELFQVIHWFNPVAYLLKKDMCEVHEYLADLQVVSGGVSKYAYQQLILDCVSNAIAPKVANAFSAKLIKNRFAMMTKNKMNKRVLVRYLAILPIVGALVALMSFRTEFKYIQARSGISQTLNNEFSENNNFSHYKQSTVVPLTTDTKSDSVAIFRILNKIQVSDFKTLVSYYYEKGKFLDEINILIGENCRIKVLAIASGKVQPIYELISKDGKAIMPLRKKESKENREVEFVAPVKGEYVLRLNNGVDVEAHLLQLLEPAVSNDSFEFGLVLAGKPVWLRGNDLKNSKKDAPVVTKDIPNVEATKNNQQDKKVDAMVARLKKVAGNETYLKDFLFAANNFNKGYSVVLKNGIVYRFYLVGAHEERMVEKSVILHKSKKHEEPKLVTFNKVNKAKGYSYVDYECDETAIYNLSVSETKLNEDYVVGLYFLESRISSECDDKTQVDEKVVSKIKSDSKDVAMKEEVDQENPVFVVVEEMPKFSYEGITEVREYFAKNVQYPKEAREKGIQGRVFVSFIVNRDGSVSDVKVERGVDPLLDNEVVRMVENMPKWTPGKQRGQAVRVAYTFPVIFNLDKK